MELEILEWACDDSLADWTGPESGWRSTPNWARFGSRTGDVG